MDPNVVVVVVIIVVVLLVVVVAMITVMTNPTRNKTGGMDREKDVPRCMCVHPHLPDE